MDDRTTGPGANPLRRKADGARTGLHAAFAVACLIAVVCGAVVGWSAWTDGSRTAATVVPHRHAVMAVTVDGTTYQAGGGPSDRTITVAPVTWHYPPDRAHRETVSVPPGTRKGDTVRVWVDDRGNAVAAPPDTAELALEAFGFGTVALTGTLLVSGVLVRFGLRIVDARCARAWETEWEDVEPLWTGRLRPDQGADDG
ncbi:hypothetical protein ACFVGY_16925 [Streptomyces sp. NPDC127106]|uniref:Rv1733c family protein n=1 Tax=Streptomyces sp. NPDC127106 TaxID=3345360 RepID=UPI003640F1E2